MDNAMMEKARWVAQMMQADGVSPEMVTPELVMAYMEAISRRIDIIQGIYLTRPGAPEALGEMLIHILNEETLA